MAKSRSRIEFIITATATVFQKTIQQTPKGVKNLGQDAERTSSQLGKTRKGVESISTSLARLQNIAGVVLLGQGVADMARSLGSVTDTM